MEVIQIDYLHIRKPRQSSGKATKKATKTPVHLSSRESKASIFGTYTLEKVLDLTFSKNENFYTGQAIKQWIEGSSSKVKEWCRKRRSEGEIIKGGLFVEGPSICGCRVTLHLVVDMDHDGELAEMLSFVGVRA